MNYKENDFRSKPPEGDRQIVPSLKIKQYFTYPFVFLYLIGIFMTIVLVDSTQKIKFYEKNYEIRDRIDSAYEYYWNLTLKKPKSLDNLTNSFTDVYGIKREPPLSKRDPWGTPYKYNPENQTVLSAGPDKIFDTVDDIQVKLDL